MPNRQEAGRPAPWQVGDAPADYIEAMLGTIVGIEIPIDRLEGKLKLSQDEALQDRVGTVKGLQAAGQGDEAGALAGWVRWGIEGE